MGFDFMSIFYPKLYIQGFGDLDIPALKAKGIDGLVLDIDNTLVPYHVPSPTPEVKAFVAELKANGIDAVIASNNTGERVTRFATELGIFAIHKAKKPLPGGLLRCAKTMGVKRKNTAVIGDQVFTDVLGANLCGMYSILVVPLPSEENTFFKVKRYFERIILKTMKKRDARR